MRHPFVGRLVFDDFCGMLKLMCLHHYWICWTTRLSASKVPWDGKPKTDFEAIWK